MEIKGYFRLLSSFYLHSSPLLSPLLNSPPQLRLSLPMKPFVGRTALGCVRFSSHIAKSCVSSGRNVVDSQMIKTGFDPNICRSNSIMVDFVREGKLSDARHVFDEMPKRNIVSTNTLISGYVKSGDLQGARDMFDRTLDRTAVTWTIIIGGYSQCKQVDEVFKLFSEMRRSGTEPDHITLVTLLSACNDSVTLNQETQVHGLVYKLGYGSSVIVCNTLVDSYCKSRSLDSASQLFDEMLERDCVTYNALITGFAKDGFNEKALKLFVEMQNSSLKPSEFTFAAVLCASVGLGELSVGQQIHSFVVKTSFVWNVFVTNALLDFYSKQDRVFDAKKLFDEMPELDGVSYNVVISGYAWTGQHEESLDLFRELQATSFDRKQFPFASILSIASNLMDLKMGKQLHAQVIVTSAESEIEVKNSLIDMYAKCGGLEEAKMIFANQDNRNTISWTAMISSYVQNGFHEEALALFSDMRKADINTDQATFASILRASANLASLGLGKQLHAFIIRAGFMSNVFAGSALLDVYANCGSIKDATQTFNEMPERNIVSWNAMIAAYARNGDGEGTFDCFNEMVESGFQPDSVTFLSILTACSHCGLVQEGSKYFDSMTQIYKLEPKRKHYACMVDILGRSGLFDEVETLMNQMPFQPDEVMLTSVLNSCRIHGNQELAQKVADQLFGMELRDAGPYVVMSNIYATAGNWDNVGKIKKSMKDRGVKKVPAYSWVEFRQKTHIFSSNDRTHPQINEIRRELKILAEQLEKEGYKADTSCALHNEEEDVKAESLMYHSERLAIAFALINTPQGSPILVVKNLRACTDCHAAIKVISRIVKREITVRDSSRFHHFKDGVCSCGDYW